MKDCLLFQCNGDAELLRREREITASLSNECDELRQLLRTACQQILESYPESPTVKLVEEKLNTFYYRSLRQ